MRSQCGRSTLIDEETLREYLLVAKAAITETYRARVETYGPDAAHAALLFIDKVQEIVDGDRTDST